MVIESYVFSDENIERIAKKIIEVAKIDGNLTFGDAVAHIKKKMGYGSCWSEMTIQQKIWHAKFKGRELSRRHRYMWEMHAYDGWEHLNSQIKETNELLRQLKAQL